MKRKFNLNIGCIIKILLVIALIMGIAFVFLTCTGGSCVKKINKSLPDVKDAPWQVATPSHLYYSHNATETKTGVIITNWYEQSGKGNWIFHKDSIELPFSIYGKIQIRRR